MADLNAWEQTRPSDDDSRPGVWYRRDLGPLILQCGTARWGGGYIWAAFRGIARLTDWETGYDTLDDAMTDAENFAVSREAVEDFPSYSHSMVERYCPHCVPVSSGRYPEVFSHEYARVHQEEIQVAVLARLQDVAVDGLVERISRARLGRAIGELDPNLRPTQICVTLATALLQELGYVVNIENFASATSRMRAPNSYQLTTLGLTWMGGPLKR